MSLFKKATAFLTAFGITATMAGCGYNTRDALEVNGYSVPAGVYIYFANSAYNQAISKLQADNEELDTEDTKAIQAMTLEDKDVRTWIEDKATEMCVDFVATEQKFDELGLTLSDEDTMSLNSMMEYYWGSNKEVMEKNGIGEASFKKILTSSYKSDAIFEYYYGIGGEMGVTEDDLRNYYAENNIRAQYLAVSLKDAEGNLLKSEGKAEMKKMVEGYQKRVEDALASGGVDAVMREMNLVKNDYDAYVTSLTAEETEEETTETVVEETTEAAAEETTEAPAEETTEAAAEETTEAPAEETTEAAAEETTEAAEEETPAVETETAADVAEGETAEETTEAPAEETTEAAEETTEAPAEETTEAPAEETTEAPAEETTEAASEETTAEETTEPTDEEIEEEDTLSYSNESIISVIHKEDYEDENDIYYNPSEKVYNKLVEIKEADYGKPYFVEEDETYYLVVRYDIKDRMTPDDLWTESTMTNVNYTMHDKELEELVDSWTDSMEVKRNAAAYKRYDPFKFDFT